ncbi:MAG: class I SAM-dependent methyltransferase [Verrucomicrobiota bacterium]
MKTEKISLSRLIGQSLRQIGERAALKDGQDVLELGCGWGSFSLWAAEHFPNSHFTAVSNSYGQAEYIRSAARRVEIANLEVITCDINRFEADRRFDRIVSVEMLEHVRNYERLFARISHWMKKEARFFAHVFCHKEYAYPFNADNPKEWMAKYFFTGGIMPSRDLLPRFDRHLELEKSWDLDGTHYEKTSNAWLANLNRNEAPALEVLSEGDGRDQAKLRLWRWRLFFLACAELFGYDKGNEWGVAHYVFKKRMDRSA